MSVTRHRWRLLLPIYATVVFFTLAHAPVQTESRYVTPARPAMAIFIALALHDISLSLSRKHRLSQEPVVPQAGSASQKASA
jgi:hypothetical protein